VIEFILSAGTLPPIGVGPETVSSPVSSGDASVIWPMFLLALFAVVAWKVWKFSRRVRSGALPKRLPKDWEDKFWYDFNDWRGDPTNRV